MLLTGCIRAQAFGTEAEADEAILLASSVPASMAALGRRLTERTLDLVLRVHTAGVGEARPTWLGVGLGQGLGLGLGLGRIEHRFEGFLQVSRL